MGTQIRFAQNRSSFGTRAAFAVALAFCAGTTASLAQTTAPAVPAELTKAINNMHNPAPATGTAGVQTTQNEANAGLASLAETTPAASVEPTTAQTTPATQPSNTPKTAPNGDSQVVVDDNFVVDLHVNDEELVNVLEMLSIQSQKSIIASKNVAARVTANLYGVTFYEALDAILNVNGYGYVQEGNFIYVYTLEEIEKKIKESRKKITRVIPLNYLQSVDAAEFVKPLLSETGQIKVNGKVSTFPSLGDAPVGGEDYAQNALLVVNDFEENITEIEGLVKQLDTRPSQIEIESTILQTNLTEANAFGVDFSLIADMDFSDFVGTGGPTAAAQALINGRTATTGTSPLPADGMGRAVSTTVGNTAGAGGLKVGVVANDVGVFLRVLDEVTDSVVLSNPKLLTLNRQAASVLVGRKVGYLSTTSTDTSSTQTVEFLDTGTSLKVRPFVTNDGMIRLELKPKVAEAVIRQVNDATGAAVTIPDEITNELNTQVLVRDGQTVVLGGLFREQTSSGRKQVPLLGDIPLIGAAFKGHDDSTQRQEIIFLITPTIVNDTALTERGNRANDHVERSRVGARESVLPWSRDRQTSMLNVEADRLATEGKTDAALHNLDRSLRMNPNQPEAIGMRERLSGNKANWPTRSFLDRVAYGETEKSLGGTNPYTSRIATSVPGSYNYRAPIVPANTTAPTAVANTETPAAPTTNTNNDTFTPINTATDGNANPNTNFAPQNPVQENAVPENTHATVGGEQVSALPEGYAPIPAPMTFEAAVPQTASTYTPIPSVSQTAAVTTSQPAANGWLGNRGMMNGFWSMFHTSNAGFTQTPGQTYGSNVAAETPNSLLPTSQQALTQDQAESFPETSTQTATETPKN